MSNILTIITFLPLVAALFIVFFVSKKNEKAIIHIATWTALADFVVSLIPLYQYDMSDGGFQFVEAYNWIPTLGVQYKMGVDGVSLLLVVLTTLLGFISILRIRYSVPLCPGILSGFRTAFSASCRFGAILGLVTFC